MARPTRARPVHNRAKVTAASVRAWRREAARVVRGRLKATGGLNAKNGAPLTSLLRGTGLFARLAREHEPPVTIAAVSMAVYGVTWSELPGALPRYKPLAKSARQKVRATPTLGKRQSATTRAKAK